ncbi:hypothetical protein [Streptomyces yaizuensis]|uniref:Alpha/beta hydrolase n=1 Tax=Streptomyces yaizuensis TaxID=2989713 RepID=A0ABQ5NSL5_9ACTN|nr:hypothetical protein [Streptomyces sp. YSPA8]GLF93140.1 alpha/beta hydrolase [Streptomyces sp. YSPA8]
MGTTEAPRVLYVHGIGNKAAPDALKSQWDRALFGRDLGDASRVAYWAGVRHARPLPDGRLDPAEGAAEPTGSVSASALAESPESPESAEEFVERLLAGAGEAATESVPGRGPDTGEWEALRQWLRRTTQLADALAARETGPAAPQPGPGPDADAGSGSGHDPVHEQGDDRDHENGYEVLPLPRPVRTPVFRALVKVAFTDVHAYFFGGDGPAIRRIVADALADFDGHRGVVVGHSLGSVIAYEALAERHRDLGLFLTAGSPLAVTEFKDLLAVPPAVPPGVRSWHNVCDLRDLVSLGHLLAPAYPPAGRITDLLVTNTSRNHHGITGYLRNAQVRAALRLVVADLYPAAPR